MQGEKLENLLDDFLQVLVERFGLSAVRNKLDVMSDSSLPKTHSKNGRRSLAKPKKKVTATEFVLSLKDLDSSKRNNLMELAKSFQDKRFMPGISDIRIFFEGNQGMLATIKSREKAMKKVFCALANLPDDRLKHIIDSEAFSGPSRLGPLSDAIADAGERRRY